MKDYVVFKEPFFDSYIPSYTISWDAPAATTKLIRRAFELSGINAARVVKWGGRYDILYPDRTMIDSGISRLSDFTYRQWVNLAVDLYKKREGIPLSK